MEEWSERGGISPRCHLNLKIVEYAKFLFQSSSGMEDKERRLWPDLRLDELGDDSHEVGTRKKFSVGSSISGGVFTSDGLEEVSKSVYIYMCEQGLTVKED